MDPQPERPIVLKLAPESSEARLLRLLHAFVNAAAIAVIVHLLYFLVIDCWWTLEHFGPHVGIFLYTRVIRLVQSPVAAAAGVAVFGTWQLLQLLFTKFRSRRLLT